jgi:hypothetical protein
MLSVLGVICGPPLAVVVAFCSGASMAVIDDNMRTAWRSVQIERLRGENGPQLLDFVVSWKDTGPSLRRLVRLQLPRDYLRGARGTRRIGGGIGENDKLKLSRGNHNVLWTRCFLIVHRYALLPYTEYI